MTYPGGSSGQAGTRATKPHAVDTAGSPPLVDFDYRCVCRVKGQGAI